MSDMYALINEYPHQFERGFRLAEGIQIAPGVKEIIIAAVSHNAATAEIISQLFRDEITVPLTINQEFDLPHKIDPQTLFIAISLCGNRAEILAATKAAYSAGAKIVTITTGGTLEDFARERKLPLILAPKKWREWEFRMGQGVIIAILTQLLINVRILPPTVRQRILEAAQATEGLYLPKLGQKLANLIVGNHLLIYSSLRYAGLANLIKNLANILLQIPSSSSSLTNLQYSEIYGFSRKGPFKYSAIILQDKDETQDIQRTINKIQSQLAEKKTKYYILDLPGSNQIEKTLATIMLTYWSIYWSLQKE